MVITSGECMQGRKFLAFKVIGLVLFLSILSVLHPGVKSYVTADSFLDISGTLTSYSNAPINGALVYVTAPGSSTVEYGPVSTNATGAYDLKVVAGIYDIHFDPSDETALSPIVQSSQTIFQSTPDDVHFTTVTHTLTGTILDPNNNPIVNLGVQLTATSGAVRSTVTDANGSYSITAVAGVYKLGVYSNNAVGTLSGGRGLYIAQTTPGIDLSSNDVNKMLVLPTATLHVKVIDYSGTPISGVSVAASSQGSGGLASLYSGDNADSILNAVDNSVSTDASGVADITTVVGTKYGAGNTGNSQYAFICANVEGNNVCLSAPYTVTGSTQLTLQAPLTHKLSGHLTDSGGLSIPGVRITLESATGNTGTVLTDSNGNYIIAVVPDTYRMSVTSAQNVGTISGGNGLTMQQSAYSIDLTSSDQSLNLSLQTVVLHITVKDGSGNPVSGSSVTAFSHRNTPESATQLYSGDPGEYMGVADLPTTTDSNGNVDLTSIIGTIYDSGDTRSTSYRFICADINSTNICLSAPLTVGQNTNIILAAPTKYSLSGILTDNQNNPLSNVRLSLTSASGDTFSVLTDSNGNYSINVEPNNYKLSVQSANSNIGTISGGGGLLLSQNSTAVDLTTSNVIKNLKLQTSSLTVNVVDADGFPLAGIPVQAYYQNGSGSTSLYNGDAGETIQNVIDNTVTTDSNGQAVMTTLTGVVYPIGNTGQSQYQYICANVNGVNTCLTMPLSINGDTAVTLHAPRTYRFTGTLKDSLGNALSNVRVTLAANDGNNATGLTDTNGIFSISAIPDHYAMTLSSTNSQIGTILGGNGLLIKQQVASIDLSGSDLHKDLTLQTVNLHITVKNSLGELMSGVPVLVNHQGESGVTSLYAGDTGEAIDNVVDQSVNTDNNGQVDITSVEGTTYDAGDTTTTTYKYICAQLVNTKVCLANPVTVSTNSNLTIILEEAPAAPTNLNATSPAISPVLNWSNVNGATHYGIYRDGSKIGDVTSTQFIDVNSTNGVHTYKVTALNTTRESGYSNTISILTDRASPTITYTLNPNANSSGYNNSAVTVTFTCNDALSGVASCTSPVTFSSEGDNQLVTGTATDNAGNTASITARVNLDETVPTISYTVSPAANASNWNNSNVLITFNCNDALSGVASCTSPVIMNSEGSSQNVTGTATDNAGNTASITTALINIDKTAPSLGTASFSSNPIDTSQGTILTVPVVDSLSGVAGGEYYIGNTDPGNGGGTTMTYSNGNLTAVFSSLSAGTYTINYRAKDVAGNWDLAQSTTLTVRPLAPASLAATSPTKIAPALSWMAVSGANSYNVFRNGSLIGSSTVASYIDNTLTVDGTYSYYITAVANGVESVASNSIGMVYDTTAPAITYALSPVANSNGYNNSTVTITFTCSDILSGVASCTSPVTISTEAANQKITGTTTDNAGNTATTTATVNIDETAPTITYSVSPVPNANGWNNANVTVTFSCTDALSGVASCSSPVIVSTEGASQTVTGTAIDRAGNTSTTTAAINLDKTAPTINYTVTPVANSNGWNNSDVTVTFTCSDALSGIQSCTAPVTLSANGTNQTATGTSVDKAGNSTSVTTAAVNLDKTAPTINYTVTPVANSNGWNNDNVTVTFNCADTLSGLASCSSPVTVSTEGASQTVTGTATDKAGNTSTATATVNIDKTAPTILYSLTPAANANGWNNGNVTVTFNCVDALSGVNSCSSPVTLTAEGANQTVTGTVTDKAGNTASVTATVSIDKTAPTISYTIAPTANANGWEKSNVTVTFTCTDSLSGIQTCPSPVVLSTDGANQTVTATTIDKAGNSTSVTTTPINLDKTAPTITYTASPAPNANGWNNSNVTIAFTCGDILSGVATCSSPVTLTTEGANQTVTGTATDKAGNTSTVTATVNIDKTASTTSNVTLSNPVIVTSGTETITATVSDALSGTFSAEYYIDTDPGLGNGGAMTISGGTASATKTISGLSRGPHQVFVRTQDKAGNWSTPVSANFVFI
jgi:protocatechuate 3,4-dioxygenase beta subunit